VDRVRPLVHILPTRHAFPALPPSWGRSPCPRPLLQLCSNSTASTGPHPGLTINSATYFMERSIGDARRIFKATIWCGLLIIWTRYVATSPFPTLRLNYCRLSAVSILPVPHSESVYVNSKPSAELRRYSQRHTPFCLTFSTSVPNHSLQEATVMYLRGFTMVQEFASNVSARTPARVQKRRLKCVIDAIT